MLKKAIVTGKSGLVIADGWGQIVRIHKKLTASKRINTKSQGINARTQKKQSYYRFIYFLILFSFSLFTEWVSGFYCFLLTVSVLLLVFLIIIVCLNKRVNDLFFTKKPLKLKIFLLYFYFTLVCCVKVCETRSEK